MQKTIILIIVLLVSCNYKPNSIGAINDIVVISSINDKIITKSVVEEMFSHSVYTPQAESKYNIIHTILNTHDGGRKGTLFPLSGDMGQILDSKKPLIKGVTKKT